MNRRVCLRLTSRLLLPAEIFFGLPDRTPPRGDRAARRVPHRYVTSNEMAGRTIFQVERVEVGVDLAPDTFTLLASESGGGK
jgi:hypothetical protein